MPARIIIADDEPLQRMDLKDVLMRRGYLVIGEATDGLSVVAMARSLRPDLVIMDIRMPGMDGLCAAETLIREKIAPVILLTAYTDNVLVQRAKDAGVINYLIKPLQESEVVPAVEMALNHYRQLSAMEERIHLLAEQLEIRKSIERSKGLLIEKQGLAELEVLRKKQEIVWKQKQLIHEDVETVLDELRNLRRGHLSIASNTLISVFPLSHFVERYKILYPNIELSLFIADIQMALEKLETHEVELLFLTESVTHPALLTHVWRRNATIMHIVYLQKVQISRAAQAFLNLLDE
jgi:AmiR/NasT family two-component response regulator